jgi:hypothetical protein
VSALAVYTCLTAGSPDQLRPVIAPPDKKVRSVVFICFSDVISREQGRELGWEILPLPWKHLLSSSRSSRWPKVNSHLTLPDYLYSIYHDATHQLVVNPWEIIERHLVAADMAIFAHPQRKCAYAEAAACIELKKDDADTIKSQVGRYRDLGWPDNHGLFGCSFLVRRNTEKTVLHNQLWWNELKAFSFRDQISFGYAAAVSGVPLAIIPGNQRAHPYFRFFSHDRMPA